MILKILFWIFIGFILYTYLGYTLILFLFSGIKKIFTSKTPTKEENFEPEVTLVIPSFNEEPFVNEKVSNSVSLDYPKDKLKIIWITDGSTDNTYDLLSRFPDITVMHEPDRRGKIHAMNRAMKIVDTPVVVFTDANSMLNRMAIREIVKPFMHVLTGCVTGEKRISASEKQKAVAAGEGLYWQYESLIKTLESETGSVVGAVGEIFAIRTKLYEEVNEDTLLDDFTLSIRTIQKGYRIKYAPGAWGVETASLSVSEETKRKVRIATGAIQSLSRMTDLLNPFQYGFLSLKYISHKVLRWTLVPFAFPIVFLMNLLIILSADSNLLFQILFGIQCVFYLMAFAGRLLENVKTRAGLFFTPYYLLIMNYAVLLGFFKYVSGNYSVKWQKVKRT